MNIKKERQRKKDALVNIIIALPLNMKVYHNGTFKQMYNYVSLALLGVNQEQCAELKKGNLIKISGQIVGNSNENGKNKRDLTIVPKTITKGIKNIN